MAYRELTMLEVKSGRRGTLVGRPYRWRRANGL